jgi:hypothetical protein
MVTDPLNFNVFSILFEVIRQVSEIKCDLQVALAIIITNFWFW